MLAVWLGPAAIAFAQRRRKEVEPPKEPSYALEYGAVIFIIMFGDGEDRPQGIVMTAFVALAAGVIATAAAMWGRNLLGALRRTEARQA